jgi:polar amino acid transport system substrate-binding protein
MNIFRFIILILLSFLLPACTQQPTGQASQKADLIFLTEDYAPLNFSKNGIPTGMSVEVIDAIGNVLKIKPDIKVQLWKNAYKTALNTPNVILFSTVKTTQRENKFYWLKPSLMKFKEYFYEKNDRNIYINKLEDAKKYKIGTTTDFSSEENLKAEGFKNIVSFPTQAETMQALIDGKVDLAVFETFRAEILIKKLGHSLSDVIPTYKIRTAHLYIAISKGTPQNIVDEWQKAFNLIRKNKTYYKIYKKWLFSHTMF